MTQSYQKSTQVNYFIFHWKQYGNFTQGFMICYIDTLSRQLFRPKNSVILSPLFLSYSNLSAIPLHSTFKIYSESDLLFPLLPWFPSSLDKIITVSPNSSPHFHSWLLVSSFKRTDKGSLVKGKSDHVSPMLKPPSGFSSSGPTGPVQSGPCYPSDQISGYSHHHSAHSRHSDLLAVTHVCHSPAPRPVPLLFLMTEKLLLQPSAWLSLSSITSFRSLSNYNPLNESFSDHPN